MTTKLTKETILEVLKTIEIPGKDSNIVDLQLLSEIVIHGPKVYFSITITPDKAEEFEKLRVIAEDKVISIPEVEAVMVTLTAESPQNTSQRQAGGPGRSPDPQNEQKPGIPGVKHIIAVASGKGGVGKSTTSVNLALAFQAIGLKTAILDADIYGPSMPRLLGITGKPTLNDNDRLIPMQSYDVKVMSMGFIVKDDEPMIWRGPMVISALSQMMKDVDWGPIDIMVVDMPPGTGDAQLTMAQKVPLSGAVIVSTPQDLALIDARKGLNMFRKVNVPLLGIIENMSYFICPNCNERSDIFGHGGAREEAERLQVPFLGEIPLHMEIREKSDLGEPVVVSSPNSSYADTFKNIAQKVWQDIEKAESISKQQGPKIIME